MTLSAKHAFTSAKSDDADTTLVRPSNWNAEHVLTAAANSVLAAGSSGTVSDVALAASNILGRGSSGDVAALSLGTGLGFSAATTIAVTDAELTALAGLTSAADSAPYFTGSGTAALMTVTSAARTVLDDATVGAMLTTLGGQPLDAELTALAGLTSAADSAPYFTGSGTAALMTVTAAARTVLDDATVGNMLTTLGGQPLDTELTALAGLVSAADRAPYFTGSGTAALMTVTAAARTILDDTTTGAIRTTLGVGTADNPQFETIELGAATDTTISRTGAGDIAVEGNVIYRAGGTDVPLTDGGTGASTAAAARTNLGIDAIFPVAINVGLTNSVGSSALTIALKGTDGNDPSSTNPVVIPFRNVTAATGTPTYLTVTAATSLVVSSGSTLGTANNVAFKLWIVGFNDAGTFRLGVINCVSSLGIYPLAQFGIASSTAEGGAGAADSAQVFYTGTAVTSKSYTILGYLSYESGLGTAGTWSATATRAQLFTPGVPLPGSVVQIAQNYTGAVATGTTLIPNDDTIPQNTEGDQYMSQAITPSSAAHVLEVEAYSAIIAHSVIARTTGAIFQDSTANALMAAQNAVETAARGAALMVKTALVAATTSSTTFKYRQGANAAGTTTFNGSAGARLMGGVAGSYMKVVEYAT